MARYPVDTELLGNYWNGQRRIERMAREYAGYFMKADIQGKILDSGVSFCPSICISRNIGVGALDVGEILCERLGFQVLDREVIEQIFNLASLICEHGDTAANHRSSDIVNA